MMIVSSLKGRIMMIDQVPTSEKVIAFTFDDGPNPIYTRQLLEIFAEVKGKATFFMIGEQMGKFPEVVKEVAEQGHEIGNHTYTHARLSDLEQAQCKDEIERNEELLKELTGKKPNVFRPPYLDYNKNVQLILEDKGYSLIGALNVEAKDWEQPGMEYILSVSRKYAAKGSILIFHDGYGDRSQTIESVRTLAFELARKGYQLITVSELLNKSMIIQEE